MSGWDMLAVALIAASAVPLLWRWAIRWSTREFDRHVDMATALANDDDSTPDSDMPVRRVHFPAGTYRVDMEPPTTTDCQCRGRLRDRSGVWHHPILCAPLRETVIDGRWGTP